jgi:hypothetical protein
MFRHQVDFCSKIAKSPAQATCTLAEHGMTMQPCCSTRHSCLILSCHLVGIPGGSKMCKNPLCYFLCLFSVYFVCVCVVGGLPHISNYCIKKQQMLIINNESMLGEFQFSDHICRGKLYWNSK